jgi:hypothetical protein
MATQYSEQLSHYGDQVTDSATKRRVWVTGERTDFFLSCNPQTGIGTYKTSFISWV